MAFFMYFMYIMYFLIMYFKNRPSGTTHSVDMMVFTINLFSRSSAMPAWEREYE